MVEKNHSVGVNFYKKQEKAITWNKKHSSKQVVSIREKNTLEKKIFATATFDVLWVLSFKKELRKSKKTCICPEAVARNYSVKKALLEFAAFSLQHYLKKDFGSGVFL